MTNIKIFLLFAALGLTACGNSIDSIYSGLKDDEDGVVDSEIPESSSPYDEAKYADWDLSQAADTLTAEETKLISRYLKGNKDRISFAIVDADENSVQRAYLATQTRILASVTKLSTAVAALENVNGIEVNKVRAMLKSSNNAEASRYVRLAGKAIAGIDTPGKPWTGHSSCPSQVILNREHPAAASVLGYIKSRVSSSWDGADLKDGAGCDYGNFMTPLQLTQLLHYADQRGKAFGGYTFEQLLSVSGVDGTWRLRNRDAKGRVLAKTGTLSAASNLTGYFYAKRGNTLHKYYFSVLISKSSSQNPNETRSLIEGLVRYWLQYYAANPS